MPLLDDRAESFTGGVPFLLPEVLLPAPSGRVVLCGCQFLSFFPYFDIGHLAGRRPLRLLAQDQNDPPSLSGHFLVPSRLVCPRT